MATGKSCFEVSACGLLHLTIAACMYGSGQLKVLILHYKMLHTRALISITGDC
jgi:hypothetical protein